MRARYAFRDGEFVEISNPLKLTKTAAVHSDDIPRTLHPVTGKPVDSFSTWKREAKARGYEVRGHDEMPVDTGQRFKETSASDYERGVQEAIEQVKSGRAPLSEYDRHVCKEINTEIDRIRRDGAWKYDR